MATKKPNKSPSPSDLVDVKSEQAEPIMQLSKPVRSKAGAAAVTLLGEGRTEADEAMAKLDRDAQANTKNSQARAFDAHPCGYIVAENEALYVQRYGIGKRLEPGDPLPAFMSNAEINKFVRLSKLSHKDA